MIERSRFETAESGAAVRLRRDEIAGAERELGEAEVGARASAGRRAALGVGASLVEVALVERDLAQIGERRSLPVGS